MFTSHRYIFAFVAILSLIGCASTPVSSLPRPSADSQGEVLVFRESAFAAGGVGLTVGVGNVAYANIGNAEKVRAMLSAGGHEIFVQARSADPTKVRISLPKGSVVCLRTSSSPSTYAKVAVPVVLMVTGYHFYLDQVPCPSASELAKYTDVPVAYQ